MSAATWQARWQQFQTLPRAVRWLLITLLAVVMFIIVDDYAWALGRTWNEKADRIIRQVADAANYESREREARSLRTAIEALGPVEPPTALAPSSEALTAVVNEVLGKYGVSGEWNPKGATTMSSNDTRRAMPGKKIDRISGELRFDATVADAIAIIADFESRPEIEAVSAVRMTRQSAITKVRVNMTIDAWVISESGSRRGVSGV